MRAWLVEMIGPCYLSARYLGGYEFFWTRDPHEAIHFHTKNIADVTFLAIRQLRPDLFPACLPEPIAAIEHIFVPGEGVRHA